MLTGSPTESDPCLLTLSDVHVPLGVALTVSDMSVLDSVQLCYAGPT